LDAKKRFTEESHRLLLPVQDLCKAGAGMRIKGLCRNQGFSEAIVVWVQTSTVNRPGFRGGSNS